MKSINYLSIIGLSFLCILSCAKKEDLISAQSNYIDSEEIRIAFNFEGFTQTDPNSLAASPGYLAHFSHSDDSRSVYITTNESNLAQSIQPGFTELSQVLACGVQASLRDNSNGDDEFIGLYGRYNVLLTVDTTIRILVFKDRAGANVDWTLEEIEMILNSCSG